MTTAARWARSRARPLAGVAILGLLVWRLGTGPFLAGLRNVNVQAIGAAACLTLLATICAAWRWRTVARGLGVGLPLGTAVAACYRAQFLNSALPGGVVGDVHRGVRQGHDSGDVPRGLRAVAWERTAGLVVFVAVALVSLSILSSPLHRFMEWITAALAVGALCVVLVARALPDTGTSRWARFVRAWRDDLHNGLLDREAWPAVLLTSVVVATANGAVFLIAARTTGSTATTTQLWPLAMLVLLAMVLPLNVGGWGPREGMAAWAFAAAGLGATQGVAAATAYGVMGLAATLPGAAVLAADRFRGRRIAPTAGTAVIGSVGLPAP